MMMLVALYLGMVQPVAPAAFALISAVPDVNTNCCAAATAVFVLCFRDRTT